MRLAPPSLWVPGLHPPNRMSKGGKAHAKLPLLMDRIPRDGHINKAHKKCTNIKSYKH